MAVDYTQIFGISWAEFKSLGKGIVGGGIGRFDIVDEFGPLSVNLALGDRSKAINRGAEELVAVVELGLIHHFTSEDKGVEFVIDHSNALIGLTVGAGQNATVAFESCGRDFAPLFQLLHAQEIVQILFWALGGARNRCHGQFGVVIVRRPDCGARGGVVVLLPAIGIVEAHTQRHIRVALGLFIFG